MASDASPACLLDIWDWRLRVGFDEHVVATVEQRLDDLAARGYAREAAHGRDILRLSASHLSVGNLLDALEADRDVTVGVAHVEQATQRPVAGCLPVVEPLLRDRITALSWLPDASRAALDGLLDRAKATPWINPHGEPMRVVFGSSLAELRRVAREFPPRCERGSSEPVLGRGEFAEAVEQELGRLAARCGELPPFSTTIDEQGGFAEYWPRELASGAQDRLVLHHNPDAARASVLSATLAHEVAGHGVFYAAIRDPSIPWIDHGAFAVVEGWATWAEWHCSPHGMPGRDDFGILDLLDADAACVTRELPRIVRARGYSDAAVASSLMMFSEQPALQLSYQFGGLWFTERLGPPAPGASGCLLGGPLGEFLFTA